MDAHVHAHEGEREKKEEASSRIEGQSAIRKKITSAPWKMQNTRGSREKESERGTPEKKRISRSYIDRGAINVRPAYNFASAAENLTAKRRVTARTFNI